jgi:homopolymeric O-antigen transport system permease protein
VEAVTIIPHRQDAVAPSHKSFTSRRSVAPARPLPEEPLIKIRSGRASVSSELREVWAHRELLYFFIWRDLKVRYKQTALGPAWVVLQPLLMALVFAVFMGKLARVPSEGVPYPLFAYAGLVPWTFFSSAVSTAGNSLIANGQLVTKVFFPRMLIHLALTGVRLIDLLVSFVVLLALMGCYGIGVSWSILLLPVLVLQATLLAIGVALWFSARIVARRDYATLLPVLLQAWMFASPIIYPSRLVPGNWHLVYSLNPLAGVIEGFRSALFGFPFDWAGMALSGVVTLLVLAFSVRSFLRADENLVDVI